MILDLESIPWRAPLAAFGVSFAACWLLARLAPRLGLLDAGDGGRKRQQQPLPLIGGIAVFLTTVAAWLSGVVPEAGLVELVARGVPNPMCWTGGEVPFVPPPWIGPGLVGALLVGLVDDLRPGGLRPMTKLMGQALVGFLLAWPLLTSGHIWIGSALVAGTIVALNAFNTFDNADGAASTLALIALAPVLPVASAAIAGFLPFNLRRADGRAWLLPRLPRAILGDAGSHLLGMLVLLTPVAWPALALPLLDLARVCIERLRAGARPWVGDRRHLAHRLERLGAPSIAVVAVLLLVAAPSILMVHAAGGVFSLELALLGVAISAALFALATVLTRPGSAEQTTAEPAGLGLEA